MNPPCGEVGDLHGHRQCVVVWVEDSFLVGFFEGDHKGGLTPSILGGVV